jgi:hypothetical protein
MALRYGPTKWSFSQEVAATVGRREPETRLHSLPTAVSARRLGVNGGQEGPRWVKGHPEATLRPSGGQPVGTRKPPSGYPEYRFPGLIHRLGWALPSASPAQPVNKSVRIAELIDNLGPAPVRIATRARLTSCSHSLRPEPVTRTRIRILRCRHSTSCTIRTAPRAHSNTVNK